MSAKLGLSC